MMQRRQPDTPKKKRWAVLIIVPLAIVALIVVISGIRRIGQPGEATAVKLPCLSGQSVTPFGEYVLYYDGVSIHCVTVTGGVRWSFPIGADAAFSASGSNVVAWVSSQVYILDQNGHSSYSDNLGQQVQFARIGKKYAAAVIGDDTEPTLQLFDLNGAPVDDETEAFSGRLMLDVGFYGEDGQYIWTLGIDVFGTAANTVLNTFEVGQMNTGEISLGDVLTYKVIYDNQKLRVLSTRQMRTFNYRGTEDTTASILVYGWKLIASETPEKGDAMMLLAPSAQTNSQYAIREVRLLSGLNDRRYTLPSDCVGAAIHNKTLYAFSSNYIYRSDTSTQRFSALNRPKNMSAPTDLIGMTEDGWAILACGDAVYAVNMP